MATRKHLPEEMKRDIVVICDIETTGFKPKINHIVEIGIAGLHLPTGRIVPLFDSVCQEPGFDPDQPYWIYSNSDLTPDTLRNAPMLEELFDEVQWALEQGKAVTAYNKQFDFRFLRDRSFEIKTEWPCPMHVATPICRIPGKYGRWRWPNVEEAWEFFFPDVPYKEKHRGYDDAYHEAQIIYKLYQQNHIKDSDGK